MTGQRARQSIGGSIFETGQGGQCLAPWNLSRSPKPSRLPGNARRHGLSRDQGAISLEYECPVYLRVRQPHLVQDGVRDAFTKRLAETSRSMKSPTGSKPFVVVGPPDRMNAVRCRGAHRRRRQEGRQCGQPAAARA